MWLSMKSKKIKVKMINLSTGSFTLEKRDITFIGRKVKQCHP